MKAVGYTRAGAIDDDGALVDVELRQPAAERHDLLVKVHTVSVNPVDCTIRVAEQPCTGQPRILGYDAVGTIIELGDSVDDEPLLEHFAIDDRVFCTGALDRPGSNAKYQLVARLEVTRTVQGASSAVVIIGGGGGVGSTAIHLLSTLTNVTVIANASYPVTKAWSPNRGTHHVLDHRRPLAPHMAELGLEAPVHVLSNAALEELQESIVEILAPQGRSGYTDRPDHYVPAFQEKCTSLPPEGVFTHHRLQTLDLAEQGEILRQVGELIDAKKICGTLASTTGAINTPSLKPIFSSRAAGRSGKSRSKASPRSHNSGRSASGGSGKGLPA